MRTVVNQDTLIPLGLVGSLLAGIFWVATLSAKTDENTRDIVHATDEQQTIKGEHKVLRADLESLTQELIDRLARIETKVDALSPTPKR